MTITKNEIIRRRQSSGKRHQYKGENKNADKKKFENFKIKAIINLVGS